MNEPQSKEVLSYLWNLAHNSPSSLGNVEFRGVEPSLPSIYKTGVLAQSTIAAAALASTEIWKFRTGRSQTVSVDIDAASASFRSENYLRVNGKNRSQPSKLTAESNIHGFYKCGDGGWIQLHANYPEHRKAILQNLRCDGLRKSVANKLLTMSAIEAENNLTSIGLPAGKMRTVEEWYEHPQGQAVSAKPLFTITKIGEADPIKLSQNPKRPLEGIKTIDLTKVIAGPLIGRTFAEHGSDVIWVNGPHLDLIESLVIDMSRGKRPVNIDLRSLAGRNTLTTLVKSANIFIQGYRPGALISKGFSPEKLASIKPGIIYVNLSAFGNDGPWKSRRGFDSIVQTVSGIGYEGGKAAGINGMKHLPCQALDHGSGYIGAFAAISALQKQMKEGGSWLVDVSLAQTGHYLTSLGQQNHINSYDKNLKNRNLYIERVESLFGTVEYTKPAAVLSETPGKWNLTPSNFGTYAPSW
tara:strand:- start:925 stop:2331 length:1407 start_codon:yes stop_codon:yes gene_type:complete